MTDQIRVGVIGAGHWGPNIARNFEQSPRSELVAICDRDTARLATIGELYPRTRMEADAAAVIDADDVDALVIATPTGTHFELTKRALLAGKHVLVEKPVTTRSDQADELDRLAKEHSRILMVGHVFLYNRAVRFVKDWVASEEFGDVYYLHSRRTNLGPVREDVHAAWDLASHDISIFLYLKGECPVAVTASAQTCIREGVPDVVFATLYFADDTVAHLHTSWLDPQKVRDLTVVGSKQMVVFDDMNVLEPVRIYDKSFRRLDDERRPVVDTLGSFQVELVQGNVSIPRVAGGEPLRAECNAFLDAVAGGEQPLSDGKMGTDVVRVLEAMDRSIANDSRRVPMES